jgi:hypothetical protein
MILPKRPQDRRCRTIGGAVNAVSRPCGVVGAGQKVEDEIVARSGGTVRAGNARRSDWGCR